MFLVHYTIHVQLSCSSGRNHCSSCSGTWRCSICDPGYTLATGVFSHYCTNCNDLNCLACLPDMLTCTSCAEGFYLDAGSCISCGLTGCDTCDVNSCLTCLPFFRYINSTFCEACISPQCTRCDSDPNICTSCRPTYGVNPANSCQPCADNNCWLCTSSYTHCNAC